MRNVDNYISKVKPSTRYSVKTIVYQTILLSCSLINNCMVEIIVLIGEMCRFYVIVI